MIKLLLAILGLFYVDKYKTTSRAEILKYSYYENVNKHKCLCGGKIIHKKRKIDKYIHSEILCSNCKQVYEVIYDKKFGMFNERIQKALLKENK